MCAVPRAVHALRNVPSELIVEVAERHDEEIAACLSAILGVEVNGVIEKEVAQLSFTRSGGLHVESLSEWQSHRDGGHGLYSWPGSGYRRLA